MRNLITVSLAVVFLIALLLAPGCEETPTVAGEDFTMTLDFVPPNPSFEDMGTNSIASTVTAVLLSGDGIPQQGVSVLFSAVDGAMDSHGEYVETDSHGIAADVVRVDRADAEAEMAVTARSGALVKSVTIPTELCTGNTRPTARITPPGAPTITGTGVVGATATASALFGTTSTDPETAGVSLTYSWTCFSGGPVTTDSTVSCQYLYQGTEKTYTVSLVVKDTGLAGHLECALSSTPVTVTVTVPAGTTPPAL